MFLAEKTCYNTPAGLFKSCLLVLQDSSPQSVKEWSMRQPRLPHAPLAQFPSGRAGGAKGFCCALTPGV